MRQSFFSAIRTLIENFGFDDWLLVITGFVAIGISILDFAGFPWPRDTQLPQFTLIGIGFLLEVLVVNANRQEVRWKELNHVLERLLAQKLNLRIIRSAEKGVSYLADKVRSSGRSIDHVALSPKLPRDYKDMKRFEDELGKKARDREMTIRYIANLDDPHRRQRVAKLLKCNRYYPALYTQRNGDARHLNFLLFDNNEIVLSVPGHNRQDIFLVINNEDFVDTFRQYFDLLWANANNDRERISKLVTNRKN